MRLPEHDLEALVSLLETGELEEELAVEVRRQLQENEDARTLWQSFRRLSELCGEEVEEAPHLPDADADRILEALHVQLDREGLGNPYSPPEAPEASEGGLAREPLPEILTVAEVARYLRVTQEELESELEGLPFFEFAGRLRMRRESLLDWLDQREAWSRRQRMFTLPGVGEGF